MVDKWARVDTTLFIKIILMIIYRISVHFMLKPLFILEEVINMHHYILLNLAV